MKKHFCFVVLPLLFGLAFSAQAGPRPKLVLLTSLDMEQQAQKVPGVFFYVKDQLRDYPKKLARRFADHYKGKGYEVQVRFGADQRMLWDTLHAHDVLGVIWFSHASFSQTPWAGISGGATIADAQGFDLTPVFQDFHPNMRFLGVIGCLSLPALWDQFGRNGVAASNPKLAVYGYDDKVEMFEALDGMMKAADKVLDQDAIRSGFVEECQSRKGYALNVTRKLPRDTALKFPAVRIERKSKVLGVFPAGVASEEQQIQVYLDPMEGPLKALELKILGSMGSNPGVTGSQVELGEFSFSEPWAGAAWTVFADREGKPLGVTSHVYRYTGEKELLDAQASEYLPYACAPMHERRAPTEQELADEKALRKTYGH